MLRRCKIYPSGQSVCSAVNFFSVITSSMLPHPLNLKDAMSPEMMMQWPTGSLHLFTKHLLLLMTVAVLCKVTDFNGSPGSFQLTHSADPTGTTPPQQSHIKKFCIM